MKYTLLLTASIFSATLLCNAQQSGRTYAITGKQTQNFLWADIKQVDIASGKVVKTLFESEKTAFKTNNLDVAGAQLKQPTGNPTGFGVAACALDTRHNRLYFAPMHFSSIQYLDLDKSTADFTTIKKNAVPVSFDKNGFLTEENQLTRMVIGADGYGYAITNDANHFIRFTTSKKPEITDLGNLIDAENNNGISVHNKCSSWGGDLLADAFGNLVLITASHNVFTINPNSRVATYKGTITGLPANYTTNGAVVDNDGAIIVSSANVFDGLFKLNFTDLKAVKIPGTENTFNASDMANGNFLLQKEKNASVKYDDVKLMPSDFADAKTSVFPNPVTTNQFNVLFDKQAAGKYTIVFTDLSGRLIQSKVVNVVSSSQVEPVKATKKLLPGTYMVKVIDKNKRIAFSDKLIVL